MNAPIPTQLLIDVLRNLADQLEAQAKRERAEYAARIRAAVRRQAKRDGSTPKAVGP